MIVQRLGVADGQEFRQLVAALASAPCCQQSALPGPLSPFVDDEGRIRHFSEHTSDRFALGEGLGHCLCLCGKSACTLPLQA
eukprot:7117469-Alexandrium_andersonii.AAC.1